MESLPQEIFDAILSIVCDEEDSQVPYGEEKHRRLPTLVTVSRRWQCYIERRTFRDLRLDSNQMPELSSRFTGQFVHRAAALSEIEVNVTLPYCRDEEVHERETEQDVWNYSRAISNQLHNIFGFLLILEKARSLRRCPPVVLRIWTIQAPTDLDLPMQEPDRFQDSRRTGGCQAWYYSRRWRYSIYELLASEIEVLPTISCIVRFQVYNRYKLRQLHYGDWIRVALKFPNLEYLTLDFQEYRANGKESRTHVRQDFAYALLDLVDRYPSTLERIHIGRNFSDSRDEAMPQTDYSCEKNKEVLSKALCKLGEKCSWLELEGINVTPELLWPSAWSNIKTVDIEFDPIAPNGEWYFTSADGNDISPPLPEPEEFDDEIEREIYMARFPSPTPYTHGPPRPPSDAESVCTHGVEDSNFPERRYRVRPFDRTISPLLIAAAKAVRCMPLLYWFSMHTRRDQLNAPEAGEYYKLGDERKFEVSFSPKGVPGLRYGSGNLSTAKLAWDALPEGVWKPEREVREEWARTIGETGEVFYIYGDMWGRGGSLRWDTLSTEEFLRGD